MKTSILRTAVLLASIAINFVAMGTVAQAQTETTRDPNTTSLGIASSSHSITAFLPLPDGRVLLAVKGTIAGAATTSVAFDSNGIAILGTDGTVTAASAGNFNNEITAMHRLPDGKILLGGQFTKIGGSPDLTNGKSRLARLNADFSLDSTFLPAPKSVMTGGLVNALAVDDQGRIYVGGTFTDYGDETDRDSLVRLFPDGMLDRSFVRSPVSGSSVAAILRQSDGKIVVAGSFTELAGDLLPVPGIYRLEADGSLDLDFNPQVSSAASQFSHAVLDEEQRIVLAQINPRAVYRLLPTGVKDLSFVGPAAFSSTINALAPLPGSRLLVGGLFTSVTVGTTVKSSARHLIRLGENGVLDETYAPGFTGSGTFGVTKTAVAANGRVYLSGTFTGYSSAPANRVLVLEGSEPALAFTAQPQGSAEVAGASATFRASAIGQNSFTFAWFKNGAPLSDNERIAGSSTDTLTISNLTPEDSADYTVVVTMLASPLPVSITSGPAPLAVISTPEIITAPVNTTANIYGTATLGVLARGGLPLSYQWFYEGEEIDGANSATLVIEDAEFSDAGRYSVQVSNTYGADTSAPVFLTVERKPGAIAADVPALSIPNGEVHAILKLQDGSILVGGNFTTITVDGVDHPRKHIARFLSSGALDTGFAPSFSAPVRALAQDSNGIYVGGDFATVTFGTTTTNYRRVLRLTSGLTLDTTTFTGTLNINWPGFVYAIAPVGDGSVFVGGNFSVIAGKANTARLARLTSAGVVDTAFASGFATDASGAVNALAYADNVLFVGGDINEWADTTGARLLKLSTSSLTQGQRLSFPSPEAVTVNELFITGSLGLVVGGRSGTTGSPTAYLKRFDIHTGASTAMEGGITTDTEVGALAYQSDGLLLVGASGKLARLNASAEPTDSSFGDFAGSLRSLAVDNSGRIWAGGTSGPRLVVLAGGTTFSDSGTHTPQTVELAAINGGVYNPANNTRALVATASSGLTSFTYVVDGPATAFENTLTITGSGLVTVTAFQAGDSTYASASASRTFAVTKATQKITFPGIAKRRVSSPPFELQATTDAQGLSVRYVVEGPATLGEDGRTLTLSGTPGTVVVTAYQDGDSRFRAADPVPVEFLVEDIERLDQRITFNQPPARVFGSAPAKLNVSTNAPGLTVTLEVIEGQEFGSLGEDNRTLTVTGAGTVKIRATQAGNENYKPAASVIRDVVINKASQSITFTLPGTLVLGDTPPALEATASSGLTVSYATGTGNTAATLSDRALTVTGAGKIVVVASQAGNANFLPAVSVTRTIVVGAPKLVLGGLVRTYTGEAQGVTVTGAPEAYADEVEVTYQLGTAPATDQEPTDAGTYRVVATLGEGARVTGTLKINKKVLTVTPQNKTLLVGTPIPTGAAAIDFFPVTYSGFVDGEDVTVIDTEPIPYATAKATSNAGTSYKIHARGGLDGNYSFAYVPGNLTLVGLAGGYEAMIVDGQGRHIGRLSLTMLRNSFGYTGSLTLAAESAAVTLRSTAPNTPLTGEFLDSSVRAVGTWSRSASGSLPSLALMLAVGSDGTLTGSVTRGGQPFGVLSEGRLLSTASTGASGVGTYSVLLAPVGNQSGSPAGVGHAKATITASGLMLLNGKLADGTILSGSTKVDTANAYRVFFKPYGASRLNNALGGIFQLTSSSIGAFRVESAAVTWLKPASSTDKSYRSGIDLQLRANMELWRAPATSPSVVTLAQRLGLAASSGDNGPFLIDFIADALSEQMLATLPTGRTLLANNSLAPVVAAENPSAFALTFVSGTGAFSGTFKVVIPPTTTPRTVSFSGNLRQPLNGDTTSALIGQGYFLFPGATSTDPQTSGEIRFERLVD